MSVPAAPVNESTSSQPDIAAEFANLGIQSKTSEPDVALPNGVNPEAPAPGRGPPVSMGHPMQPMPQGAPHGAHMYRPYQFVPAERPRPPRPMHIPHEGYRPPPHSHQVYGNYPPQGHGNPVHVQNTPQYHGQPYYPPYPRPYPPPQFYGPPRPVRPPMNVAVPYPYPRPVPLPSSHQYPYPGQVVTSDRPPVQGERFVERRRSVDESLDSGAHQPMSPGDNGNARRDSNGTLGSRTGTEFSTGSQQSLGLPPSQERRHSISSQEGATAVAPQAYIATSAPSMMPGSTMGVGLGHGADMHQPPRPPMGYVAAHPAYASVRSRYEPDNASFRSAMTGSAASTSQSSPSLRSLMVAQGESLENYRQKAKDSNDPKTQLDFAAHLISTADGIDTDEDPKKAKKARDTLYSEALKWVKKLATNGGLGKTGFPDAQFFLAECYGNGSLQLTIDHDRAFNLYVQASKQGHPAATYRTAVCYEVGAGTKRDANRALTYYRKAAALGDTAAMYKLGMILMNGFLGQAKNPREGVTWLKRAAQQADESTPHALHELAILYEGTQGDPSTQVVIPDPTHAHELYLRAAQLGYAPSQYKLGLCYEYGLLNLPVDPRRSIAWYTRAAEQQEPEAELALSGWYLTGAEGVLQQSDREAYLWARKAADKGLAKAEFAVGYYYEKGIGTDGGMSDYEEARRWYLRAAAQGNKRAIQWIKDQKQSRRQAAQPRDGGAGERAGDWRKSTSLPAGQNKDGECLVM